MVVALDGDRGSAGEANALDHVRIERALGQEIGAADLARFLLEHVDKRLADELALGLGIADAGEAGEEQSLGVHMDERDVVMVAEEADDLRSEEHTSELQSLMRISYAVFCLQKKKDRQK